MDPQRDVRAFGAICSKPKGQQGRRAAVNNKEKVLVPRSSSPVQVYVDFPCVIEQAFSTIAWDDLEDCTAVAGRECDSLGSQANESDADEQNFGDYALDFMADSPATLESSLSSSELVPFQGCVIPSLIPQLDFSPENSLIKPSSTEAGNPSAQDGACWQSIAQNHGRALEQSLVVNNQLHETLHRRQEEIDSLQERNLHLRQLANRAKHLASVLEKLMMDRDANVIELPPCADKASLSPCKRQRMGEGYETESSSSVEDMLKDVSARCNAVLHSSGSKLQQDSGTIQMFGSFAGLQTCTAKDISTGTESAEAEERVASFTTSVREHCTIRTHVFPHGCAFTSRSQQGEYRFRWVPKHS